MLAHILAIAVGLGSFAVYMAAFFFPEVHRKNDFFWSGVGFFYALILWVCAGRITGAVLLGQMASVALLGWFAFQTLYLRRVVTPASEQTPVPAKLQEQVSSLLAVQAEEPRVTPTPTINSINQDTTPPVAVQPPAESVAVEPAPETVETEQQTEAEVPVSAEIPSEILSETPSEIPSEIPSEPPEPIAEIPPNTETVSTSETEIAWEQQPVAEKPEPEPVAATEDIELEDELDEVTEEKTETAPQPQVTSKAAPKPKRLSRVFRTIAGLFNRRKNQPSPPVSPVETSAENQPETVSDAQTEAPTTVEAETEETPTLETVVAQEDVTPKSQQQVENLPETQTEAPKVEAETEETPTLETVVAQEDVTPQTEQPEPEPVAETETIDLTEIDSSPLLETPSDEGEVQEITVTVEPDISSVSPFEKMASSSAQKDENSTEILEESSEEIVSEPAEEKASPAAESSAEIEPSPVEENPALKRPNPPDPKLRQASKKPKSSTDSDDK